MELNKIDFNINSILIWYRELLTISLSGYMSRTVLEVQAYSFLASPSAFIGGSVNPSTGFTWVPKSKWTHPFNCSLPALSPNYTINFNLWLNNYRWLDDYLGSFFTSPAAFTIGSSVNPWPFLIGRITLCNKSICWHPSRCCCQANDSHFSLFYYWLFNYFGFRFPDICVSVWNGLSKRNISFRRINIHLLERFIAFIAVTGVFQLNLILSSWKVFSNHRISIANSITLYWWIRLGSLGFHVHVEKLEFEHGRIVLGFTSFGSEEMIIILNAIKNNVLSHGVVNCCPGV